MMDDEKTFNVLHLVNFVPLSFMILMIRLCSLTDLNTYLSLYNTCKGETISSHL